MRYFWLVLALCALLTTTQTASLQEYSIEELETLSTENVGNLTEITRLGNGELLGMAAFSHDGSTLAVAGSIGIWFYEAANLQASPDLLDVDDPITGLVFLNQGQHFAYSTASGAWVIDMESGSEVMHFSTASIIAGHPNDQYILVDDTSASTSENHTDTNPVVELWDVVEQTRLQTFSLPVSIEYAPLYVKQMAVSPDGRYFASSYSGRVENSCGHRRTYVLVWDTVTNDDPFLLHEAENVAFSPDSSILVSEVWYSAGPDIALLHVLDLETREIEILETLPPDPNRWGYVTWFGFNPATAELMALTEGTLRSWTLPGQVKTMELDIREDIDAIFFDANGRAISITEGGLTAWSSDFQEVQTVAFDSPLLSAQLLEGGDGLYTIDDEARLYIWRVGNTLQLEETFVSPPTGNTDYRLILSADSAYLAFAQGQNVIVVSTVTDEIVSEVEDTTFPIGFSGDSTMLVLKRVDTSEENSLSRIQIWDLTADKLVREFGPYNQTSATTGLTNAQLNLDGSWIGIEQQISVGHNRYTVFSVSSGEEIYTYELETGTADWTPDLRTLIVRAGDQFSSVSYTVRPQEADHESVSTQYPYSGYTGRMSPDGTAVFFITSSHFGCGGDFRQLYVHSLPEMSVRWTKPLPMRGRNSIDGRFDTTGTLVFSVNAIFDGETGDSLYKFPHDGYDDVGFSHDNRFILTFQNGTVRLWGVNQ